MAKTVTITKQSQIKLKKKFSQRGTMQECIDRTKVSRNTLRDLLRLGTTSDSTIQKLTPYTGAIKVKEA